MPVHVGRKKGKYRILEHDGSIATTDRGNARDGGGHGTYEQALRQARAINMHLRDSGKGAETLYIHRPLLNGPHLLAWAVAQGFNSIIPIHDLHVTIAFSKKALNWSAIPFDHRSVTVIGGQRSIEKFDGGAVVLRFKSKELEDRWQEIIDQGASWDWPHFKPHITLSYSVPPEFDIDEIDPFDGVLKFGHENWSSIREDWKDDIREQKLPDWSSELAA